MLALNHYPISTNDSLLTSCSMTLVRPHLTRPLSPYPACLRRSSLRGHLPTSLFISSLLAPPTRQYAHYAQYATQPNMRYAEAALHDTSSLNPTQHFCASPAALPPPPTHDTMRWALLSICTPASARLHHYFIFAPVLLAYFSSLLSSSSRVLVFSQAPSPLHYIFLLLLVPRRLHSFFPAYLSFL